MTLLKIFFVFSFCYVKVMVGLELWLGLGLVSTSKFIQNSDQFSWVGVRVMKISFGRNM